MKRYQLKECRQLMPQVGDFSLIGYILKWLFKTK